MNKLKAEVLFESLTEINDPRRQHQKFHSLFDILVISIGAVICAAEPWTEIEEFGAAKQEWFSSFLELENGIPSYDTLRRVFILLDNIRLKEVFVNWISSAVRLSKGSLANIDGKNLCGSREPVKGRKAQMSRFAFSNIFFSSSHIVLTKIGSFFIF
ncbi:MAG TPA: ISAs1 family transposase [Pyrinomonadaceae bacterium]|nr:ISAs1 family transposase [Pyrinomonadaceae bacterium]